MFPDWQNRTSAPPPSSGEAMLAACLAAIATLLIAPLAVKATHEFVYQWAEDVYGIASGKASLVSFAYDLLVWPTLFFALKTSIQAALVAGVLAATIRFI